MNIKQIFKDLIGSSTDPTKKFNTKLVGFNTSNSFKAYLAIDIHSNNQQCILLQLKNGGQSSDVIINNINTLNSIQIDSFPVLDPGATKLDTYYSIKLNNNTEEEIFYKFVTDIIETAKRSSSNLIILDVLKRVKSWMNFFKAKRSGVLSDNAQIGLFAELSMLKYLLEYNPNKLLIVVNSWVGPKGQNQDFIFPNTNALEIKCTTTNNPYDIRINNEYQLDSSGLDKLFLCVYQVKRHKILEGSAFISLPNIIKEIEKILNNSPQAKFEFINLLIDIGYLVSSEIEYEDFGFQIINNPKIYNVDPNFPKLSKTSIPKSLKKVEYTVNIQNQQFLNDDINDLIKI
jgi:hypothetical protein